MNIRVRVLDVTHVQPEQATTDHQPRDRHATINLSPFDTFFLALPPIQRLFFYEDDVDGTTLPPFPSLVSSLRASLAATLAVFSPLAGKLTARSHDDFVIDCSPDAVHPGVRFVEAEYSGDAADMRRLARDVEHNIEAFLQLVPALEVGMLPAPVLAVQVTRPAPAGGDDSAVGAVAVGVTIHHAVADGQSLWQFFRAWAAASRDGSPASAAGLVPPPTFDRAPILQHPKAEAAAREFARLFAPEARKVNMIPVQDWTGQSRRTYLLTAGQIQSLKRRIVENQAASNKNGDSEPPVPPTSYVAIASLLWICIARAKSVDLADATDDAYFLFPADCRRRLRPPLDPSFFGNCIKVCYARATAGDLLLHGTNDDDAALARAAAAVRRAIREHVEEEDPLGDADRWFEINRAVPRQRLAKQGSSHRFMAYEVDFGWGAPTRVELVSVFSGDMATLVGARGGAVQVSVALGREHIDGFEASFLRMSQHEHQI